ncbi:MAG: DegT/DnrJ/EryC1/StrS family aminotransferase, partial [Chloroflexota bacterium]
SAALGNAQISRLDELLANRQKVADWYKTYLEGLNSIEQPYIDAVTTKMSWFVYVVRVPQDVNRDKIIRKLADKGIPARPYFAPIHLQPFMMEQFGYQSGDFPVTEDLGKRGMALPFSGVMTEKQVKLVCETLQQVMEE